MVEKARDEQDEITARFYDPLPPINPDTSRRTDTMTRYFFDTEFIEDGRTIDLLSIAIVSEDGREYYAEPAEADRSRACEWVTAKVLPHLRGSVKPRAVIAQEIREFVGDRPEFWAYYADYDWVALCQLYGRMIDIPTGWPKFCRDLQQEKAEGGFDLPEQTTTSHDALADARWVREAFEHIMNTQKD